MQRTVDWNNSVKDLVPTILQEIHQRYENKFARDSYGLSQVGPSNRPFAPGLSLLAEKIPSPATDISPAI